VTSATDTKDQIEATIQRLFEEVPALGPMKLVVGLQLHGRGDTQQFRIELPGPKITKDVAADAKIRVEMQRAFFNEMSKDARIADWREAFYYGKAKATGVPQFLRLIERVVELAEERARTRRARQR
jgi:hypothetical protein